MATTRVLNTPELLSLIGHACCLPWQYYNRDEVHGDSDLHEVLALHTVSRDFYHHFSCPFPRTALSICTAHQLHTLFLDVIAFEEHGCQCALSSGDPQRVHINFLNLYLLEVDLHNKTGNGPLLWDIAQRATPYMTNWTELNIVTSDNLSTTMLSRARHWWRPSLCHIQTLRLKDECNYGVGQFGVSHLFGPSPWDSLPWLLYVFTPFHNLRTLLIDTPAFPYPVPLDIDLDTFANAANLGAFLQAYNFTPHDLTLYIHTTSSHSSTSPTLLPSVPALATTRHHWEDPQGGTRYGCMFHILQRPLNPDAPVQSGINVLDHYDGQTFNTDPFSDWVGPYTPDPSDPLSPQIYEHPVHIYASIEGPTVR
ncbi:uncharacterized protein TRAVEDRAFT_54716 [Trametes versicolor FP-101664 SS1]|uniref:Uncharacterized protein n=1 Tax=Trametes versicolor (strain FP-101664) TaxID=717944 RepID=R7S6Q4_TRAVS|nr:uncharacterized protein TRAVEDRAFT_54716 [Trametes versicolor FP-101664 SS1]EIW51265.1 hypothetical protein TRAVEDRAFT_54716 [Trametes versicolor FP-101664 SS1]